MTILLSLLFIAAGILVQTGAITHNDQLLEQRNALWAHSEQFGFKIPPASNEIVPVFRAFAKRMTEGEIAPQSSRQYQSWEEEYRNYLRAEERDLFMHWGVRPGMFTFRGLLLHPLLSRHIWVMVLAAVAVWWLGCHLENATGFLGLLFTVVCGATAGGLVSFYTSKTDASCVGPAAILTAMCGAGIVATQKTQVRIWTMVNPSRTFLVPSVLSWGPVMMAAALIATVPAATPLVAYIGLPGVISGFLAGAILALASSWRSISAAADEEKQSEASRSHIEQRFLDAVGQYQKGNYQLAEDALIEILRIEPDHLRANELLVKVYLESPITARSAVPMSRVIHFLVAAGDVNGAYRYFQRFSEVVPDGRLNPKALHELGKALDDARLYREAIDVYYTMSRHYGVHPLALKSLHRAGMLAMDQLNNYQLARRLLLHLREIAPDGSWRELAEQALEKISW